MLGLVDKTVNAGVGAQQGFDLQRNMALFIILDNFNDKFKGNKYFLSLEHLEDIIFCFINDIGESTHIDTYQSKKKSTGNWTVNQDFAVVVAKILETGGKLISDPYPKAKNYQHALHFSSNAIMHFTKSVAQKKPLKPITFSEIINDQNLISSFPSLNIHIQSAIKDSIIKKYKYGDSLPKELEQELENLKFLFVDMTKTSKEQENQLEGKLSSIFGNKINDKKAAIETLFSLFNKIGLTYNQKNIARLNDKSKRVESDEVENALDIITTKSKAFDYWRKEERNISRKLQIRPFEKENFELMFYSAFDFFKSNQEAEHQRIITFVKENYLSCQGCDEEECISELFVLFNNTNNTTFEVMNLKAVLYAAYFETIYKTEVKN
jgi:hypothetical protein